MEPFDFEACVLGNREGRQGGMDLNPIKEDIQTEFIHKEDLKELIIADFGYYMIGIFLGVLGIAILSLLLYALFY